MFLEKTGLTSDFNFLASIKWMGQQYVLDEAKTQIIEWKTLSTYCT